MSENSDKSIESASNLIARNAPVALVVGAAGFLGSHLTEELLKKGIQVIGVDNFKTGNKEYLEHVVKDRRFHFINLSADKLELNSPRLDYIFVVAGDGWDVEAVLRTAYKYKSKTVFISYIELYDNKPPHTLSWFKTTERKFAEYAASHNLNTRITRFSSIYGPRMHFKAFDPMIRLLQAAINGNLQTESTASEFSSRALYINDAINLIVKSMLSGATAEKIFDGALETPIKVTEIKQVLLDPIWHENRNFEPSELPPWPTPNLLKTMKHLSWRPESNLITSLKETLKFFTEHEIKAPEDGNDDWRYEEEVGGYEKPSEGRLAKVFEVEVKDETKNKGEGKKGGRGFKSLFSSRLSFIAVVALVFYALVYPVITLGWQLVSFRNNLTSAAEALEKGEFETGKKHIIEAKVGIDKLTNLYRTISDSLPQGILDEQKKGIETLVIASQLLTEAAEDTTLGTEYLYQSLTAVTGELTGDSKGYMDKAHVHFTQADEKSAKAIALIDAANFAKSLPTVVNDKIGDLRDKLYTYSNLIKKGRAASSILPSIVGVGGKKSYLVLFQNNNELRPSGGFIGSFAHIDFEGGKLKKLEVQDIYAIDGQLKIHVEPPKEIKDDLGQVDWYLRDSNFEADFPTAARQAEWFYNKETGKTVDGVIALDLSAIETLLEVTGPLHLTDYNEEVTAQNLFEKAVANAEQGFFPGSQAKKNFLSALTNELFNKLFFAKNQSWPNIVTSLGKSMDNKHLLIYLSDSRLLSYVLAQNWGGVLPREPKREDQVVGQTVDFLFPVEANLGANKVNYYLDREYDLQTRIDKDGEVIHRLKISYTNRSQSDAWPGGKYKNRMRVYLPFGTKLNRALWGEVDITKEVSLFSDYGRTGLSMLLELPSGKSRVLVLDYQLTNKLTFKDNEATYTLNVIKQPGTLKDSLDWEVVYPINYSLVTDQPTSGQQYKLSTDLSRDRSLQIKFKK